MGTTLDTSVYDKQRIPYIVYYGKAKTNDVIQDEYRVMMITTEQLAATDKVDDMRRKGKIVKGFANFPNTPTYNTLKKHLMEMTELGQEERMATMRREAEQSVRAQIEAEMKASAAVKKDGQRDKANAHNS